MKNSKNLVGVGNPLISLSCAERFAVGIGMFFLSGGALQAADFPDRPISIVVPYGPGSANDMLTRLIAPGFSKHIKGNVVVLNRPGAGGAVGTADIVRANPDGYTIGIAGSATLGVNPNLYDNLPYDTRVDFTPLIQLATAPNVLVVPAESPTQSVDSLLNRLRSERLRYNSFGNGTTQHLAGSLLVSQAGAEADHIPYRSAGEALAAVMSGQVDFGFYALPAVMGHIESGRLRALGVTSSEPASQIPDVPALNSLGLEDFDQTSVWFGLVGPAGIPDSISQKIFASVDSAISDPDLQDRLSGAGYVLAPSASPEEFEGFISGQLSFWQDIVEVAGAKVE